MPELPLELCEAIVEEVDSRSDLLSLLLVSIEFSAAAERRLYHTISLPGKIQPLDTINKKLKVFERISTCPRVASHVRRLVIADEMPPFEDVSTCFAQMFLSVHNLKRLDIYPSYNVQNGFQAHAPFLLHTFYYSGSYSSSAAKILEAFLEAQVELKELSFLSHDEITLTPSALPRLTTIHGPSKIIRAIMPGRPVTRVAFHGREDPSPVHGTQIRSLCIGSIPNLKWYANSFATLTFLQCMVWDHQEMRPLLHLECLSSLEKLRLIIASALICIGKGFFDPVFAGCPSLSSIKTHNAFRETRVWTRGSQSGTASFWDPDEWKMI